METDPHKGGVDTTLPGSGAELFRLWLEGGADRWKEAPWWYLEAGRRARRLGHPSLAFDLLEEGLRHSASDREMQLEAAFSLLEAGSLKAARGLLNTLQEGVREGDAIYPRLLTLRGRLGQETCLQQGGEACAGPILRAAAEDLRQAYELPRDHLPGIYAAGLARVADMEDWPGLVERLRERCERLEEGDDIQVSFALAQAELLSGHVEQARQRFQQAAEVGGRTSGPLVEMRRQLRLLARHGIAGAESIRASLAQPSVVVFVGHMIDAPGRASPRFPAELEDQVAEDLARKLEDARPDVAYFSLACGGDLMFYEAMRGHDVELHAYLPFEKEDFRYNSVSFAGQDWDRRFDQAMEELGPRVHYAVREGSQGDVDLFAYNNEVMTGLATLRARQLETEPTLLALMEPGGPRLPGGVQDSVEHWWERGRKVRIINLSELRGGEVVQPTATGPLPVSSDDPGPGRRVIRTMLFADMVGFSRLQEERLRNFVVEQLDLVRDLLAQHKVERKQVNTWGDGLFVVFDQALEGARFALDLRDKVHQIDWVGAGLGEDIDIRIALHTGPVLPVKESLTPGGESYYGSHVNRAARIEPVTDPGEVFLSEQAAALLEDNARGEFICEYVGRRTLAKDYDTSPLYRLERDRG